MTIKIWIPVSAIWRWWQRRKNRKRFQNALAANKKTAWEKEKEK